MKRIQKLIGLLLVFGILLSMLPVSAQAAESGSCGDNLTWTLNNGTLTISGTGPMDDYSWSYSPWYESYVTKVVIAPGVTSISAYAFANCYDLTSVTIPDSVTTIHSCAFGWCDSLETVTIPKGVTMIAEDAFAGCLSLTSFLVDEANPNYSNDARGVLFNKDKTVLIASPRALSGHYTIPNTVEVIGTSAFEGPENLSGVTISEGVTTIEPYAFAGCINLEDVVFPSSLKTIGDYAFASCFSLTDITLPEGITSIETGAFEHCENLRSVQLPDSLKNLSSDCFAGCYNLSEVLVKDSNPNYSNDAQGALYNKNKTKLILCPYAVAADYVFPASVTTIGESAFYECGNLTYINIPSTVTTIEDNAFSFCYLAEVMIPDSVTYIAPYAFAGSNFSYIDLPKSLTEIAEGTFAGCSCLRNIVIPEGVQRIGYSAFEYCSRLTSITIPDSVTVIEDWAFNGCENLWHIYFTGSKSQWNRIATGEYALPENVTIHFNQADPTVRPDHICPSMKYFLDAPGPDNWAHIGVDYCVEYGLMNGTSDYLFNPGGVVSRAQLVTILYRAAGWPWVENQGTFSDVPEDTWYTEAVEWAADEGIVQGIGGGKFGPDQNITREQIATILYRFEGSPKVTGTLNAFPDKGTVSDFAYDAMIWATSTGLINGINSNGVTKLAPKNNATRDQIAAIIMRYLEAE